MNKIAKTNFENQDLMMLDHSPGINEDEEDESEKPLLNIL